jgi:hypothetical protein
LACSQGPVLVDAGDGLDLQASRWEELVGYQTRVQASLLTHKASTVFRLDGSEKIVEQVLVTPEGLTRLAELGATH